MALAERPSRTDSHTSRRALASLAPLLIVLIVVASSCSTAEYEPITAETDLTGAYVTAFQTACDIECGAGRIVYLTVNVSDPSVAPALVDSVPAEVRRVEAPIAVRDELAGTEVAVVFNVEEAVVEDDVVVVVRIGRSEVSIDISSYAGADYLTSLEFNGGWVLRTPEDTGITVTTSVS